MTVSYQWQLHKPKRYRLTLLVLLLALLCWFVELGVAHWWSWAVALGFAAWSIRFLVDHRALIDEANGTFTREKLLLGRYLVGALRLPLSEFTGVTVERRDNPDRHTSTLFVCLRQRSGDLMQVCLVEGRPGEPCEAAERTALELAELTRLNVESAPSRLER